MIQGKNKKSTKTDRKLRSKSMFLSNDYLYNLSSSETNYTVDIQTVCSKTESTHSSCAAIHVFNLQSFYIFLCFRLAFSIHVCHQSILFSILFYPNLSNSISLPFRRQILSLILFFPAML